MGNGDGESAASRAQQQDDTAYEVATGEHIDDHTASVGVTIRPGSGVESVRVRVPGLDEFEISPGDLHDWLQRAGLIHTPQQWTAIDQQLQQAIQGHPAHTEHHGPGAGNYQWEDYAIRHNQPTLSEPEREAVDEEQSQAWNRMLAGWQQFLDQVHDLRSLAGGDAESVIRQVGHTITALNMIENNDWASPYSEEFAAWEGLSADGVAAEGVPAAAAAIADAGEALYGQWHAAVEAGNYDSYHLYQAQHAFIEHCAQARTGLQHAGSSG
jgi:hypothetical protein